MASPIAADLLIHSAQVCPIPNPGEPQHGNVLGRLRRIADGALALKDGLVVALGKSADLCLQVKAEREIDASDKVITPGFVDPHTHIPWVGDRANEFEMRAIGASYMEIMEAGGGIMSTVRQVRRASVDQLVEVNLPRLDRMLAHGTTTAEMKTGYGLTTADELKQLDALHRLDNSHPIDIEITFMGAHAVPAEYHGRTGAYVNLLVKEMLPAAAEWARSHNRSLFCDVLCEEGVFDLDQARHILTTARELGFGLKIHADEFESLGGARLACELEAISADVLVKTTRQSITALGRSHTIAVSLPGTAFGLGHLVYTPAKEILAAGGALALGTDLSPGASWCESMQFVIALATRYLGLTPAQALAASTINAAYAIGRGDVAGSLSVGRPADLLILDIPDYRNLGYRFGTNLVQTVIKHGEVVV